MAKLLRLLILIPLLLDPFNSGQTFAQFTSLPWQNKVDPWVLEAAAQGPAEFILMLSEQADLSAASRLDTKLEKGTYVYEQLTQTANRTQKPVLAALDAQGAENQAYWIANMIWVRGGSSIVQAMALRADIAHIYANPTVQAKLPTPITPASPEKKPGAPDTIEWNISWIRAPQVWAKGFTVLTERVRDFFFLPKYDF